MAREIDKLVQSAPPQTKMKLVIASCSRSGTYGLYNAMKILGYRPYHMAEAVRLGIPHMKILTEAVIAQHDRFSGIKRYARAEFEKWLAGYDLHLPRRIGDLRIPNVKFILTERHASKWVASMNNTVGGVVTTGSQFPMNILKRFNPVLWNLFTLTTVMYRAVAGGTIPGEEGNEEALRRFYVEYIASVKKIVPKERLLVLKLEDGFGWDEICPFLEIPIPEEAYPRGNEQEAFKGAAKGFLKPRIYDAIVKMGTAVAVFGVVGYLGWRHRMWRVNY
ncbi:hypothetical protein BJX99DRAFT_252873 [Aspergillus californicus]